MALTLEQLQEKRAKIVSDMADESRVEFEGRAITKRSHEELEAALAVIDREIAKLGGAESRVFTVHSTKGLV